VSLEQTLSKKSGEPRNQ